MAGLLQYRTPFSLQQLSRTGSVKNKTQITYLLLFSNYWIFANIMIWYVIFVAFSPLVGSFHARHIIPTAWWWFTYNGFIFHGCNFPGSCRKNQPKRKRPPAPRHVIRSVQRPFSKRGATGHGAPPWSSPWTFSSFGVGLEGPQARCPV